MKCKSPLSGENKKKSIQFVNLSSVEFYLIANGEINIYPERIQMIFSQVKEYDIFTSEN